MKSTQSLVLLSVLSCIFILSLSLDAYAQVAVASNTGAASMSIPIEVPPGRNGIAPQLALTYNSNQGNGKVGMGWDLSLGEIARSTKKGVDYSANEYVFGPTELVNLGSGNYVEKIESSFSKYYLASYSNPNSPSATSGWVVTTKDGTKYYYGTTAASRQDNTQGTFKWLLDKVQDTNGNYMSVSYWKDQGEIYLNRIDYTGNVAGIGTSNYVQFYYETRTDTPPMYQSNAEVKTAYRLHEIQVYGNNQLAGKYVMGYDPIGSSSTSRSLLKSVTQYGNDGFTTLPVQTFDYTAGGTRLNYPPANGPSMYIGDSAEAGMWDLARIRYGDFNGDGRVDIAIISVNLNAKTYSIQTYLATETGFSTIHIPGPTWPITWSTLTNTPFNLRTDFSRVIVGDFDGDGKTDLAWIGGGGDAQCPNVSTPIKIYLSTGNGFTSPLDGPAYWVNCVIAGADVDIERLLVGDFNGDGKTDIAVITGWGNSGAMDVFLSNLPASTIFTHVLGPPVFVTSSLVEAPVDFSRVKLGDFNGDGKTDIMVIDALKGQSSPVKIYLSTGNGFYSTPISGPAVPVGATIDEARLDIARLKLGDFNGDGKTDVLYAWGRNGTGNVFIALSTGNGFAATLITGPPIYVGNAVDEAAFDLSRVKLADINGDGKTDIAVIQGWGDTPAKPIKFYLSTGAGYTYAEGPPSNVGSNVPNATFDVARVVFADFNGDGMADMARAEGWGSTLPIGIYYASGQYPDLLNYAVNGYGGITRISYEPSSMFSVNEMVSDNMFPSSVGTVATGLLNNGLGSISVASSISTLPFIVQLVSSVSVYDGGANTTENSYYYSGGLYDAADREYRGFGYVENSDLADTSVGTYFYQDDIFKGLPYAQTVSDTAGNFFTGSLNYYQSSLPYSGVNFPYLSMKDDYLCDAAVTMQQVSQAVSGAATVAQMMQLADAFLASRCKKSSALLFYGDSYGNITRKYSYGDAAISGDEKDEYIDYTYDTTNWIVSTPQRTRIYDSSGVLKSSAWFDYWPGTPNLKTKTLGLNVNSKTDSSNPQIAYEYEYGNVTKVTDARGYYTTSTYDSTKTYPSVITNYLGHQVIKTYDYRYGKVLTETDPNGSTITNHYDPFGRPKDSSNPNNGSNAYKWKESYYDGLGRTIKIRTAGPDGKVIVQETKYNNMGRVYQTSLPYFESVETPKWTTYYYDPVGRVKQVTNPDSTSSRKIYYQGSTTIVDANNHQKVEEKDVYGRLIRVREYTGSYPSAALYATTTYNYDVLGNLTKVTDAKGNQTTINYDSLSRKTSMTDPDMGYWQYGYDKNGNLISQTDAKNQTIQFSYDPINRVQLKHYVNCSNCTDVNYTYDEIWSPNPKGRLTTVTDASGMQRQRFYYDILGRATTTIKTVDNIDYTIETTYDSLGRTESMTYPDGEVVYYTYDDAGNLTNISNITNFAGYSNFNALGQVGNVAYGNNVTTAYQFYPLNNRLSSITTNGPGGGLQNIYYGYDNAGNITGITDYIDGSRSQTFVYDELNRIRTAQRTSYETINYTYDEIGNIKTNSRVGSYTYGTKPHAVTQAGPNSYSYDANGNMYSGGGRSITYDFDNRPISMTKNSTITLVYDYSGQRVKKNGTIYIGKLYECTGGTCTKHIFAGSARIASKTGSNTNYYHTDHLGSSSVVTDKWGAKSQENYYYPFGETRIGGNNATHYKFTGQEEDPETGLYYYGARYYDPVIGRFVSADSVVHGPGNPQNLDRYSYVLNNPLIYIDPSGHSKLSVFLHKNWRTIATLAIAAVAFYAAGEIIAAANSAIADAAVSEATELVNLSAAQTAGIHAGAGALSGGLSSAINRGDIGLGMATGGLSAGIANYAGSFMNDFSWVGKFAGQTAVGGVTGGVTSSIYGGGFGRGFVQGAKMAGMAFLFNESTHDGSFSNLWATFADGTVAKGLDFYGQCMGRCLIAPGETTVAMAAAEIMESSLASSAMEYAASTPSKTFGTSFLMYPFKSQYFRTMVGYSRGMVPFGAFLSVTYCNGICLPAEINYITK